MTDPNASPWRVYDSPPTDPRVRKVVDNRGAGHVYYVCALCGASIPHATWGAPLEHEVRKHYEDTHPRTITIMNVGKAPCAHQWDVKTQWRGRWRRTNRSRKWVVRRCYLCGREECRYLRRK